jgi:hypothetical protein
LERSVIAELLNGHEVTELLQTTDEKWIRYRPYDYMGFIPEMVTDTWYTETRESFPKIGLIRFGPRS